jgi:8-oxo-dGTP pyrophosphatase MutT (NUDIX family)
MPEEITTPEIPGTMQTVGILVFNEDNSKVLLVKHTKEAQNEEGVYGLPAGKIELGESPKEAAVRELMEETGLIVSEETLEQFENNFFGSDIIRTKGDILRHAHMKVFHATAFEGELKEDEKTIPEWVDLKTIEEWAEEDNGKEIGERKRLMPNISNAIQNYLESAKEEV